MSLSHFKKVGFAILCVFLVQRSAHADNGCNRPDVIRISRPEYPLELESEEFTYSFRFINRAGPNAPTVIFIPGGPGSTSMDYESLAVPSSFNIVLTNMRGSVCNPLKSKVNSSKFYSTENVALDIVAIVRYLKLTHYVLYGLSYGTMVATQAVELIQNSDLPPPVGVVLEGTVGKYMERGEFARGNLDQWERVKATLNSRVIQRLETEVPLLGLSARTWGNAIQLMLIGGTIPVNPHSKSELLLSFVTRMNPWSIENVLSKLEPWTFSRLIDPLMRRAIETISHERDHPVSEEFETLYREIACRELSQDVSGPGDLILELHRGDIKVVENGFCKDVPLDRPFDSKNYRIQSPIVYFHGENDPVLPLETTGMYHFENQNSSQIRAFVKVKKGGHPVLMYNLRECAIPIWKQIFDNPKMIEGALKSCPLKTETLIKVH